MTAYSPEKLEALERDMEERRDSLTWGTGAERAIRDELGKWKKRLRECRIPEERSAGGGE